MKFVCMCDRKRAFWTDSIIEKDSYENIRCTRKKSNGSLQKYKNEVPNSNSCWQIWSCNNGHKKTISVYKYILIFKFFLWYIITGTYLPENWINRFAVQLTAHTVKIYNKRLQTWKQISYIGMERILFCEL